ncbi:hypothetical protein D0T51_10410 [Parabacteroides sp. 52]|uniref:YncE family protein n=1 Tax=unclassified Parabacteroides TaxID=2649774 RepID=UPI0013CFC7C0|nr:MULTISPECIES: DUF5074 domain-containing protein [unclassified Parabacteroides]MDH6534672.1 hypothetical protein [Parabacteroides sp. PM5-20]NDV56138.1 hypothetical protein [Parabacteroides sp. 52]
MKTKNLFYFFSLFLITSLAFTACDDDNDPEYPDTPVETTGVYILNSGKYMGNNSTLDFYNPETKALTSKVFSATNSRGLGDTANDMLIYGGKMYIALDKSNTIEITDLSAKSLQTISPKDAEGQPQSPRYLTAHNGKVYVTLFDGHLACIDTTSMEITQKVKVGPNPEKVAVAKNKLYVANSGGYNPVQDSTLSIVDAATFTVSKEVVKVVLNPRWVETDNEGNLYVMSSGNYYDIKASLQKIDPQTGKTDIICVNDQINMTVCNDKLYIITSESNASTGWKPANTKYMIYDIQAGKITTENFITDGTTIENPAYVNVDPVDGSIYITAGDYTNTGDIYVFSAEGKKINSFGISGINPMGAFFVTQ